MLASMRKDIKKVVDFIDHAERHPEIRDFYHSVSSLNNADLTEVTAAEEEGEDTSDALGRILDTLIPVVMPIIESRVIFSALFNVHSSFTDLLKKWTEPDVCGQLFHKLVQLYPNYSSTLDYLPKVKEHTIAINRIIMVLIDILHYDYVMPRVILEEDIYNEDGSKIECVICMEYYSGGDQIMELPCQHYFHVACIVRWLCWRRNQTCPYCRLNVRL